MTDRTETGTGVAESLSDMCGGALFSAPDTEIAELLNRLAGDSGGHPLGLAAALASRAVRFGDSCVDLKKIAGSDLRALIPGDESGDPCPAPSLETWRKALRQSGVVFSPEETSPLPLVLDGADRLYMYRYWSYESSLVSRLLGLAGDPPPLPDLNRASAVLARLFPSDSGNSDPEETVKSSTPTEIAAGGVPDEIPIIDAPGEIEKSGATPDMQKLAAAGALLGRFTVITGGPGTGKTTTVVKVLAFLAELASTNNSVHQSDEADAGSDPEFPSTEDAAGDDAKNPAAETDAGSETELPAAESVTGNSETPLPAGDPLRIALAAPTGKAAARLKETILRALEELPVEDDIRAIIPSEAVTLHRLLGWRRHSPYFRRNRSNPLPHDIVVVDEASMIDMALSAKLLDALRPGARLILLGDRDQLASVEAGAVLADICDAGIASGFSGRFVEAAAALTGGEAPDARDGSAPLSDCIIELKKNYRFGESSGIGRFAAAVKEGNGEEAVSLLRNNSIEDLEWLSPVDPGRLEAAIRDSVVEGFRGFLAETDPAAALSLLDRHRILCPHRVGSFGVTAVNRLVERILAGRDLLSPGYSAYRGRPVLVTENDYTQRLFNGDVGIALPVVDPERVGEGALRVWFSDEETGVRGIPPARLPAHEAAFAMTVHKSQGSEFDHVLLLLPDRLSPILTRELLYTAVTRARKKVTILGDPNLVARAVSIRVTRASGLADRLSRKLELT